MRTAQAARTAAALAVLLLAASCGAEAAATSGHPAKIANDGQDFSVIARGRYLATVGDCAACHTAAGGQPYAGGKPIETPFGTLVAPNLTPDRETGIGAWSDDEFVNALQNGTGRGGERLYPAMPYPYYTRMSREDVLAIRAYLHTLEPVHHEVISNKLPFPFNIRWGMAVWDALFFTAERFKPDPKKSAEWNRGAYLVEGPGHCGACHTAKNWLGGDETSRGLEGGVLQGWYSPDITRDPRRGLGSWSADEIVTYLQTGRNRISAASGPMAEVIADSTSHMSKADLEAIASYLKDRPAPSESNPKPIAADDPVMHQGQALYVDNCSACHTGDGSGIPRMFPALKSSPLVQSADPTTLIRTVLHGSQAVATERAPTGPAMPAFEWKLTDAQIAAVLTYIRNSWGNAGSRVAAGDVSKSRQQVSQGLP